MILKKLILSVIFSLVITSYALAISIAPIPVELKPGQKVATLTLKATGDGESSKVFEVKVYRWNLKSNKYDETGDLIVYPKASKLPANFKIALKQRDFSTEKAFRVILKEIPAQSEGINFAMSYDIPVFVKPFKVKESVDVQCKADSVVVTNTGNVTVKVTEVDGQGVVIYIAPSDSKQIQGKKIKIKDKEYCISKEVSI